LIKKETSASLVPYEKAEIRKKKEEIEIRVQSSKAESIG